MRYKVDIPKTLILDLKKDKRPAQKVFYELYSKPIYNTIFRMVNNREDVADLMQETFIKAFKSINQFNEKSELSTWLYRIAFTTTVNFLNAKKNIWLTEVSDFPEKEEALEIPNIQPVLLALKELPEGCRVVFNLHYIEGYQHKEIANILSISESTSKSQLNRAKKLLKEILLQEKHYENR